jgi:hypothetical protein
MRKGQCVVVLLAVAAFLAAFGLVGSANPVLAQDYGFQLDQNISHVYINPDGSARVVYDLTFTCDPSAHPIDIVDIGLPNESYQLGTAVASINGAPVSDIRTSEVVDIGVEIHLGPNTIPQGRMGTIHFEIDVARMLYQDTKDAEYASLEFSPTWYDGRYVSGVTTMEVSFHFPSGVSGEEPRWHDTEPTQTGFEDDRVVYTWVQQSANPSTQYTFGASFPKAYVAEGAVQKAPAFDLGKLLGTILDSPLLIMGGIAAVWAGIAWLAGLSQKRRRMEYLPPALAVEGVGVKRGLTAVEAAILLQAPLDRVMTMILFGLLRKRALVVAGEKPLRIRLADPLPEKLWYYERRFLKAVKGDGTLDEDAMRDLAVDLVGDVNKKLAGFSRRETVAYYKDVVARAWTEVESADTPQVQSQRLDEGLEWTMLDEDFDDRMRRTFRDRPVYVPHWWWGYRPWVARSGLPSSPPAAPAAPGRPVTLPTLPGADFANTVVTSVENAANSVVRSVESFTGSVTQKTNPPPKSSSSSRRGGGYSCACACACAGCACACAGGGR